MAHHGDPNSYVDTRPIWFFRSCRYAHPEDYPDGCEHEDCLWWEAWDAAQAHLHAIMAAGCTCPEWGCRRCEKARRKGVNRTCRRHRDAGECPSCIAEWGLFFYEEHPEAARWHDWWNRLREGDPTV